VNAKRAREARQLGRAVGTLRKRGALPLLPTGATQGAYKVPRAAKRRHDALDHRARGRISAHWRSEIAAWILGRGDRCKIANRAARAGERRSP
jgi:hypothetical protein